MILPLSILHYQSHHITFLELIKHALIKSAHSIWFVMRDAFFTSEPPAKQNLLSYQKIYDATHYLFTAKLLIRFCSNLVCGCMMGSGVSHSNFGSVRLVSFDLLLPF